MAELHLAVVIAEDSPGYGRLTVLKRVRPRFEDNPDIVAMLIDEAKLGGRFGHRNLIDVLELSEVEGLPFYAMRYIPGADLRVVLRAAAEHRRPMPVELAVHVALELATALHYAHELTNPVGDPLGIVHRDVSTANVRLSLTGAVYLLDFGVAKSTTQSIETKVGVAKGNASYMSPEQCQGLPVDRRSDVFALGIILYEMVTTRRLFPGERLFDAMLRVCNAPILPPTQLRPTLPPALEAIIMRALERDPSRRFASAQQMIEALAAVTSERGWSTTTSELARYLGALFPAPRRPSDPVEPYPAPDIDDEITVPTSVTISLAS